MEAKQAAKPKAARADADLVPLADKVRRAKDPEAALVKAAASQAVEPLELLWRMVRAGAIDPWATPALWGTLEQIEGVPADVLPLLRRCPPADALVALWNKHRYESSMLHAWPAAIDALVCEAYVVDPTAFAGWRAFPEPARRAMHTVLARFADPAPPPAAELADDVAGYLVARMRPWVRVPGPPPRGFGDLSIHSPALAGILHRIVPGDALGTALLATSWARGDAHGACYADAIARASADQLLIVAHAVRDGGLAAAVAERSPLSADAIHALGAASRLDQVAAAAILRCGRDGRPVPEGWETGAARWVNYRYGGFIGLDEVRGIMRALGPVRARRLIEQAIADADASDGPVALIGEYAPDLVPSALATFGRRAAREAYTQQLIVAWGIGQLGAAIMPTLLARHAAARPGGEDAFLRMTIIVALVAMVEAGHGGDPDAQRIAAQVIADSGDHQYGELRYVPVDRAAIDRAVAAAPTRKRRGAVLAAVAPTLPPAAPIGTEIRALAEQIGTREGPRVRIFVLERGADPPLDGHLSHLAGTARGVAAADWPRYRRKKMEHVLTLSLADLPGLPRAKQRRSLALFVSKLGDNQACDPGTDESAVIWLDTAALRGLPPAEGDPVHALVVTPVEVPAAIFKAGRRASKPALATLRGRIRNAPGYVGGGPLWIQDPQPPGGDFVMQFSADLVFMNLGGGGTMYVFDDAAFWQTS